MISDHSQFFSAFDPHSIRGVFDRICSPTCPGLFVSSFICQKNWPIFQHSISTFGEPKGSVESRSSIFSAVKLNDLVMRGKIHWGRASPRSRVSSVIYFRHNDMQDCVIKLGKWYRTAVAEARGRLFVFFFCGSSRKQMLCNRFLHIIHSLDISFLYLRILAMRSRPYRNYRNCMLKETSISL